MSEARIDVIRDANRGTGSALASSARPAPQPPLPQPPLPQPPRFALPEERDRACETLARAGYVVAEIEGIGPSVRGRLAEVIDDAIERELRTNGASGPGMQAIANAANERDTALGDQIHRARSAGAGGIAVVLGPLRAAAGPSGALDPGDCAVLRLLAEAAQERPIVLMLDARDAQIGGYADPVALERILGTGKGMPSTAGAAASMPASAVAAGAAAAPGAPYAGADASNAPSAIAGLAASVDAAPAVAAGAAAAPGIPPAAFAGAAAAQNPPPATPLAGSIGALDRDDAWRSWTLGLAAVRGPQPLGSLERLFTNSYAPLNAAIASGLDDPRAKSAHDEFRDAFARNYTDAFATFAATTKRPRMVLDVHDVAARIGRLHGARTTRLLLVDAMRWDLSRWISARLITKLASRAVLTDELLLWSALPTTTGRQLETIARGIAALRCPAEPDVEFEPPRGRGSEHVRRMRVGPRELSKVDLVESRLSAARGGAMRALPEIADSTAEVVARYAETLAPHTLLFVFGDHGFTVDRNGSARQGGASPEEVLAGAFALLVGEVH